MIQPRSTFVGVVGVVGVAGLAAPALTLSVALLAGCGTTHGTVSQAGAREAQAGLPAPSPGEVEAIAEEGFIYGLPIVMNYAVMYEYVIDRDSGQWKAPFNEIANEHRVFTYEDTTVVTPNSDTPYSMLFLDLRAEPIVITVPPVAPPRYYSVMLCDGNCFNYGYIGSRATGGAAGDYLVVGPRWQGPAPAGIKGVFHSSTDFSSCVFRTQLFDADDMPDVIKVQTGYRAWPLSAWQGKVAPPAPAAVEFPKIDKELVKTNFFEYLDFALQFAPPGPEEREIRAKLARIGVGPGKTFEFSELSPEHKAAVVRGMKAGEERVEKAVAGFGKDINGWRIGSPFGDRDFYAGDWLKRAAAAKAGIYGNDAVEAMYPMTKTLADGTPLDGSKHKYTLTFAPGQSPPVNAFWSVTMYDGTSQLLIKNPIGRYLINSPMLPGMTTGADGSLTLYIQKDSPGKDKESNWLPAPDGPIYLVLRLYWPKTESPSILPAGQGTWQPPAIALAD
jgi:hypothetical protein